MRPDKSYPGLKEKPLAEFKQKVPKVVDNGRFQCMFRICALLFLIQKLKHEGVFDHMVSRAQGSVLNSCFVEVGDSPGKIGTIPLNLVSQRWGKVTGRRTGGGFRGLGF